MKTSSPAEMVGSIDDLLTEFFLRIPLKPLFQLKLVSKHWNSLISDPKLHSNKNKKPVGFIFQIPEPMVDLGKEKAYVLSLDRSSPVERPSITELDFASQYLYDSYDRYDAGNKIYHSCNGLLVGYLWDCKDDDPEYCNIKDYFVRNPTTGKHRTIRRRRGLGSIHWMYLVFDPSNSPHYKIVCVISTHWNPRLGQCRFAVYSSKTRSWKKYDNKFSSVFEFEDGVYWNGSIHCIDLSKTEKSIYFSPPDHDHDDDQNVVDDDDDNGYDDYESDDDGDSGHHLTVSEMPTPPTLGGNSNDYFGESGDHLNFISYYGGSEDECYKFQVYEMRRDYSEWFVRYNVDVSNVWSRVWNKRLQSFGCPGSYAVCGLVRGKKGDDDEDDSFLVLLMKDRMLVYNVVNGTFEITSEFGEDETENDLFYGFRRDLKYSTGPLQYIESPCFVLFSQPIPSIQ